MSAPPMVAGPATRETPCRAADMTPLARTASIGPGDIEALIGHERGFTHETYSAGLELGRLREIVERSNIPACD
jgi:hypothetical protein